jgi:hypothetical protein
MCEGVGAGVVCSTCKGTGCHDLIIEYDDFEKRKAAVGVVWVYECNPGIGVGQGGGHAFKDFGGISYSEWIGGSKFLPGTEMRNYVCPAWWFQSSGSRKKPEWRECKLGNRFADCILFPLKNRCWERWDMENKE